MTIKVYDELRHNKRERKRNDEQRKLPFAVGSEDTVGKEGPREEVALKRRKVQRERQIIFKQRATLRYIYIYSSKIRYSARLLLRTIIVFKVSALSTIRACAKEGDNSQAIKSKTSGHRQWKYTGRNFKGSTRSNKESNAERNKKTFLKYLCFVLS